MPNAIAGNGFVCVGYTTQLFDSTPSGVWSSSDTSIATVDNNGIVTGIKIGSATITYTISGASTFVINVVPVQVSNGFNLARIYNSLKGRIGWVQPTKANSPVLDARNLSATSGRYFTEGHELVSVNNIRDSQEDPLISDYDFNQYLQQLDSNAIMRCLPAIFNEPFIEHRLCYIRRAYQQNVLIPLTAGGSFCGYRIVVAPGNYAVVFNAISLFFNGVATFNIYLFNDLILAPVKQIQVTTVANSQTKVNLDWAVNYIQENNNGGIWYIGYFDKDLPVVGGIQVQAIDEQLNLWENSLVWGGTPFTSPITTGINFNRRYVGTVFYSYGLNVEMSSYSDYTELIVKNPQILDEVRILTYAITVLGIIKNGTRSDNLQRILEDKMTNINLDLNLAKTTNDFPFVSGLKEQLSRSLKTIKDSFKPKNDMQSLPCTGGGGTSIYDMYQGFNINDMPARQTLT